MAYIIPHRNDNRFEYLNLMEEKMGREVDPKGTPRAAAYELWMKAPNPMVTFFKTLDVSAGAIEALEAGEQFKDVPWKAAVDR